MLRALSFGALCLTCVAALGAHSAAADPAMPSGHDYLLGTWQCSVNVAPMGGQPASTQHGTMIVGEAPGRTLHWHISSPGYMASTYAGYDESTKTHWMNTVDTGGTTTAESSKDGKVFTGMTFAQGKHTPVRDTLTQWSATKMGDRTEMQVNGKWVTAVEGTCTK